MNLGVHDLFPQPDAIGWTPLHWACSKGLNDEVKILLANKADPNAATEVDGWTASHDVNTSKTHTHKHADRRACEHTHTQAREHTQRDANSHTNKHFTQTNTQDILPYNHIMILSRHGVIHKKEGHRFVYILNVVCVGYIEKTGSYYECREKGACS